MPEKIKGYRELTVEEVDLINHVKTVAEQVGHLVGRVQDRKDIDPRWAGIAKTDLQKGFMSLIRAIAKPETF